MQFNQERVLERLIEMIKIDSVSYKEGPMTDYLQKYFEDRGYEVYRDEAGKAIGGDHSGNLLIHIGGDMEGEGICLNAHQDTVEPGIGWIRGYMAWQKEALTLTLTPGTWSIFLRLNLAAGEFTVTASEGSPVNSDVIRDLVLAEIVIPANASAVTSAMITDTRGTREKCGYVTSTVDALDRVENAGNADMLGGTSADGYLKRSGGTMTGALTAARDSTGMMTVRNIGYGSTLPDTLADGDLFILLG